MDLEIDTSCRNCEQGGHPDWCSCAVRDELASVGDYSHELISPAMRRALARAERATGRVAAAASVVVAEYALPEHDAFRELTRACLRWRAAGEHVRRLAAREMIELTARALPLDESVRLAAREILATLPDECASRPGKESP